MPSYSYVVTKGGSHSSMVVLRSDSQEAIITYLLGLSLNERGTLNVNGKNAAEWLFDEHTSKQNAASENNLDR